MIEGRRLGPYQVQALLGTGGMGEVYRARDTKLYRHVAIKVLLPAVANDPDRRSVISMPYRSSARRAPVIRSGLLTRNTSASLPRPKS